MDFKDYYKALGLERSASEDDIKKAFRRLARKFHPDLNTAADASARMQELNEAYEVLGDKEKRAAYDDVAQDGPSGSGFEPPPGWDSGYEFSGGPSDFSDGDHSAFFEALFGAARRSRSQGAGMGAGAQPARQGQDHHAKITVPLEDAIRGATRTITLQRPERSPHGQVELQAHSLQVAIPKGIRAGQQIRLQGQGAAGFGEGLPGDLYLEVAFEPHPRWRVDGRDLYVNLPVTPWEAALGAHIEVLTPDGLVEMNVPPDSPTGRKLRLRGRGIPGNPAGDFYVVLEVVLPPAHTESARAAYRQMARDLAFDPRPKEGVAP